MPRLTYPLLSRVLDKDDGSSTPISAAELQRLRSQLDGLETLVSKVVYKNSGNRNDDEGSIVELEGALAHLLEPVFCVLKGSLPQRATSR